MRVNSRGCVWLVVCLWSCTGKSSLSDRTGPATVTSVSVEVVPTGAPGALYGFGVRIDGVDRGVVYTDVPYRADGLDARNDHGIELFGGPPHCAFDANPRTLALTADELHPVVFEVECGPPAGADIAAIITATRWPRAGSYLLGVRLDGTGLMVLADQPADYSDPVWSQDGQRGAFVTNRNGDLQLEVFDTRSLAIVPLGEPLQADESVPPPTPAWSPDGTQLALSSGSSIRVFPADGGASMSIPVAEQLLTPAAAAWSPDGRSLAVTAARGIIVVAVEEGTERLVTGWSSDLSPAWAPAASIAFFREVRQGGIGRGFPSAMRAEQEPAADQQGLWTVDPRSGEARYLASDASGPPLWSPTSAHLAYATTSNTLGFARADGSATLDTGFPYAGVGTWRAAEGAFAFVSPEGSLRQVNPDGTGVMLLGRGLLPLLPRGRMAVRP